MLFAASYLEGPAFAWFNVYLRDYLDNQADPKKQEDNTRQVMESLKTFKTAMRKMFGILDKERDVEQKLQALWQTGSASEFTVKFQQLAVRTQWGDSALTALFYQGLKEQVKDDITRGD